MTKDEILAKSREENKDEDERERQIRSRAVIPALISMGLISVILMWLEVIFLDGILLTRCLSLVISGTVTTQFWYLAANLKKKVWFICALIHTFSTIMAILTVIMAFQSMM